MNKNDVKQNVNIRDEIHLLHSYFHEPQKNEIYFLNKSHRIGMGHQWLIWGGGGGGDLYLFYLENAKLVTYNDPVYVLMLTKKYLGSATTKDRRPTPVPI